ncbi:MAG: hypothetical protein JWM11_5243 [Planctomycetaceae bacterium]|nr:hypothetical protein [Planctomycetaceae bacterium]
MFVKNGRKSARIPLSMIAVLSVSLVFASVATAQQSAPMPPVGKPGDVPQKAAPAAPDNAASEESPPMFQNGIPGLAVFLKFGMERHPEVIVARSRVEAARAELVRAEALALKSLMQLHHGVQSKRKVVELLKRDYQSGGTSALKLQTEAAELSMLEWEMVLTLGFQQGTGRSDAGLLKGDGAVKDDNGKNVPATPVYVDIAYPKGNKVDRIKEALNEEFDFDFVDATLDDVCNVISEKTGIKLVVDRTALTDQGYDLSTADLNVSDKEITLGSLFQRLEDRNPLFYFVVRDYGVLVAAKDGAPADAVSLRDFWKLSEEEITAKYRAKRELEGQQSGGMGGGFF